MPIAYVGRSYKLIPNSYKLKYMPLTKSAKKALRGSKNKALFNLRRKTKMVKAEKSVKKAVLGKGKQDAKTTLSLAYKAIDKAMKRGVIKKNTAARKKSQLAKLAGKKA